MFTRDPAACLSKLHYPESLQNQLPVVSFPTVCPDPWRWPLTSTTFDLWLRVMLIVNTEESLREIRFHMLTEHSNSLMQDVNPLQSDILPSVGLFRNVTGFRQAGSLRLDAHESFIKSHLSVVCDTSCVFIPFSVPRRQIATLCHVLWRLTPNHRLCWAVTQVLKGKSNRGGYLGLTRSDQISIRSPSLVTGT